MEARRNLAAAFEAALKQIPSIRRARIGRRITRGRGYEALMSVDYQYAALLEFDDAAGLDAYLEHPAHQQLGTQFFDVFEQALMYDFNMAEGTTGVSALLDS
jgi:hypothetical protein